MGAKQTGYTELFADGTAASPSIQIGRPDTGLYVIRGTDGVPTGVGVSIAGTGQPLGAPAAAAAPVDAVAATGTLTSNNTNVSAADTVTLGSTTYTFRASLTPTEGEVLIGADADASLLNLIRAINHSGTAGTDYSAAAAHPTVSAATSVTSHAFVVTARTKGTVGNAIASTETASTLSFGATALSGGIDGTAGTAGQIVIFSGQPYIATTDATTATSGAWKKLSTAVL